ncbi:hypothetical protein ANO11243_017050 [Dothideomycetidae sp. 11243]|nr:hypothetical protein ANO11243_017050 [fungal sp. No.11243]
MAESSPDGSPTPRKPLKGGVVLPPVEKKYLNRGITMDDTDVAHPSLKDVYMPSTEIPIHPHTPVNGSDDDTYTLSGSRASYDAHFANAAFSGESPLSVDAAAVGSTLQLSGIQRPSMVLLHVENPETASNSPSDQESTLQSQNDIGTTPASSDLPSGVASSPKLGDHGFHDVDSKSDKTELDRLREQLMDAQAKLAHLSDELAQTRSNTSTDSEHHSMDVKEIFPDSDSYVARFAEKDRGVDFDCELNDAPLSWASAGAENIALMEGSVPDLSGNNTCIPQAPFEPGVIGQSNLASPYRLTASSFDRVNSVHLHSMRPFVAEPSRRGPENAGFGNPRMIPSWGPPGPQFSLESSHSSRSMTPITGFGSLPPSMNSSTMSLPALSQHMTPMSFKSQSFSNLSPTAAEFPGTSAGGFNHHPSPWNFPPREESQQNYMINADPPNYRRLLERSMSCNWKYIVDKIVCNNDQQASIFLQQKLKAGTGDQKYAIIQAILDQAYPLMINRFGNFLIQRCFEHGTPEQVVAIARAIRGNTLNLSMDAFGCHVVQKAFDCAPEEYKAIMVHELLRRIPETVIHRYACHVWQKLFELRWNGSPPQIMKYVNEALRSMWHEVALGETGSLVVQNIFENCLEEDKRPCVNEVLASIDVIAHGQFGNWCIQHICEHGSIPDRTRAVEHVLRFATEYSIDQFASKVVEKCLKIGGTDFLDRYLDRVCEARPDRPRMPLIDITGDQFGNYLIQYILTNADTHRREIVASHVRRHMVSLRGSKYGSRVAMLCTNPAVATRPGPGGGHSSNMDRGSGSTGRGYSERGSWANTRSGSYDRGF